MIVIPMWLQVMIDGKRKSNQTEHADFLYYYPRTGWWAKRLANDQIRVIGHYEARADTPEILAYQIEKMATYYQSDYPRYDPKICYRYIVMENRKVWMAEDYLWNHGTGDVVPWELPMRMLAHKRMVPSDGFYSYGNYIFSCFTPLQCVKFYHARSFYIYANAIIYGNNSLIWRHLRCHIPTTMKFFNIYETTWLISKGGMKADTAPKSSVIVSHPTHWGLDAKFTLEDVQKVLPKIITHG